MSKYKANYQIGLDPKITNRAKIIFPIIILLLLSTFGRALYAGIKDGSLAPAIEKSFISPFKEIGKAFESKSSSSTYTFNNTVIIATPSATVKNPVNQNSSAGQIQPPTYNCTRLNIREGEFASNKCYSAQDYNDLQYYLGRLSNAKFELQTAEDSMNITCHCRVQQECDFFKDSCSSDQQQKSQAESDISKYRGIIQGIISKGK